MKYLFAFIGLIAFGCSAVKNSIPAGQKSATKSIEPMTATGPTEELFLEYELIRYRSPDLIASLVQAQIDNPDLEYRLNIFLRPENDLVAVTSWFENSYPGFSKEIRVRFLPFNNRQLPGANYVQDNFHFFWDKDAGKVKLIVPAVPGMKEPYQEFANLIDIATEPFQLGDYAANYHSANYALKSYAAGGNMVFLPGHLGVAVRPIAFERFLDQLTAKSGYEFEESVKEEAYFERLDNPELSASEANERAIEKVTGPNYVLPRQFASGISVKLSELLTSRDYTIERYDDYSISKKQFGVGHIDEYFTAFRTSKGGNCEIGILVPDPLEAFNLVKANQQTRSPDDKRLCAELQQSIYENPDDMELHQEKLERSQYLGCQVMLGLTDDEFITLYNSEGFDVEDQQITETTDKIVKSLSERGCHSPLIVKVPSFTAINVANALVLTSPAGESVIIRPNSFYGPIEQVITSRLEELNIKNYATNSVGLAVGQGNLHCGTKVITGSYDVRTE
ncbi:MAG: hypothetical protein M3Q07_26885 [Pseudobdellovibrionaceae bacterium]|nr:hypothetical protein [Pseudobdellovibrionaceae bacterium]